MKRNKEGFVSLKLISSFKRVKHLTKDWRQVAAAIERKSDRLEVNDLKTKVRRLDDLPEYDETTPSRTVVALNLPLERPTIEGVAEIFGACGDIVLIRILRPGNPIPADIKPFVNKHPEMVAKVCALVEFERTEFALKAVRELNNADDPEKMTVMELTAPPPKKEKKEEKKKAAAAAANAAVGKPVLQAPVRRFSHAGFAVPPQQQQHQAPAQPSADQLVLAPPRRRISLYHNMKFSPIAEEQTKKEAIAAGLNPNAPTFQMQQQQAQQKRSFSRPQYMHPAAAMEAAAAHAAAAQAAHQAAASMQMQMAAAGAWMSSRQMAASGLGLPPNVLRMPRGPDAGKGRGFQKWCRSRMAEAAADKPAVVKKSHAVPIVAPPQEEEEEKPAKRQQETPKIEVTPAAEEDKENKPSEEAAAPAAENNIVTVSDDDEGHYSEPEAPTASGAVASAVEALGAAESEKTR